MTIIYDMMILEDRGPFDLFEYLPVLIFIILSALGGLSQRKKKAPPPDRSPQKPVEWPDNRNEEYAATSEPEIKPAPVQRPSRPIPRSGPAVVVKTRPMNKQVPSQASIGAVKSQPMRGQGVGTVGSVKRVLNNRKEVSQSEISSSQQASRPDRKRIPLNPKTMRQAVILSTIIGKPKADE